MLLSPLGIIIFFQISVLHQTSIAYTILEIEPEQIIWDEVASAKYYSFVAVGKAADDDLIKPIVRVLSLQSCCQNRRF